MKIIFLVAAMLFYITHYAQQTLTFDKLVNLVPEGIAIDSAGNIFISSIAQKKIIRIRRDGSSSDFIQTGQDNFLEGLGMKVDVKRHLLWALSNIRNGNTFTSQIHAFDLVSGKTKHKFTITDTIPTLFNDLLINESGTLLITDTYNSSIYTYDAGAKKLDVLFADTSKIKWPNGIDFLDRDNLIVATYGKGLVQMNFKSKIARPFGGYKDQVIAFGLDGIVVYGTALYGVYNAGRAGYPSNVVVKYSLDHNRKGIISEELLGRGNGVFADPTTAAIYNNKLYIIANSHLDDFNKNNETVPGIENILTPLKLWVLTL